MTAAAAATSTAVFVSAANSFADEVEQAAKPLKILILGGTGFLGPHQVRQAVDAGHTVTLANRGKTRPELFDNLEQIRIDREGDLAELEKAVADGKTWDAVLDNSGYVPAHVTATAEILKDAVKRYVFISTISVYGSIPEAGIDETFRVTDTDDEQAAKVTKIREVGALYGPLKYRCEVAAESAMPGRVVTIRPGLIAGPGDPTDRFTYWPVRTGMVDRCGGKMLVPGSDESPHKIQIIDARDLAAFCLQSCGEGVAAETYNLVATPEAIQEAVAGGASVVERAAEPELVTMEFLATQPVAFWQELPAVITPGGPMAGMSAVTNDKATAAGLKTRPMSETATDTHTWWRTLPADRMSLRAGLTDEKEQALLTAWADREQ